LRDIICSVIIKHMTQTPPKILIVDDDESFLLILKNEFTEAGFLVATIKDGKTCLSEVKKEKPALVITDIMLPGIDGVETAKKIRQLDKDLPIIFLSNVTDSEYLDSAKDIGNCDRLVKANVQISDIIAKAKEMLNIK